MDKNINWENVQNDCELYQEYSALKKLRKEKRALLFTHIAMFVLLLGFVVAVTIIGVTKTYGFI